MSSCQCPHLRIDPRFDAWAKGDQSGIIERRRNLICHRSASFLVDLSRLRCLEIYFVDPSGVWLLVCLSKERKITAFTRASPDGSGQRVIHCPNYLLCWFWFATHFYFLYFYFLSPNRTPLSLIYRDLLSVPLSIKSNQLTTLVLA